MVNSSFYSFKMCFRAYFWVLFVLFAPSFSLFSLLLTPFYSSLFYSLSSRAGELHSLQLPVKTNSSFFKTLLIFGDVDTHGVRNGNHSYCDIYTRSLTTMGSFSQLHFYDELITLVGL